MSVRLQHGDCREVIKTLADCSVDSGVMDPPYSLISIQKRFGKPGSAPTISNGASGVYKRASSGFMGQQWDTGETAFDPAWWAEVLRVLKPGSHLVAFSGTRTYHRMACAIEDAGFEIRDQLAWAYGSGFPKSHSCRAIGRPELGTALKPAWEPICFARKPLTGTVAANVLQHGTGAINIDGCRIGEDVRLNVSASRNEIYGQFKGAETEGRVAVGRWPANLIHDGSEEVLACFPDNAGAQGDVRGSEPSAVTKDIYGKFAGRVGQAARNDSGSAARFFFSAKADADDRWGSKHPTVKPIDLMRWLARLVTPPGGTVLDPFAGSGTTGVACLAEGFDAILIEREAEYAADIRARLDHYEGKGGHSMSVKNRNRKAADDSPLFGRAAE